MKIQITRGQLEQATVDIVKSHADDITLEIPDEQKETCKSCSTERRVANNGTRYLCNHFSEYCDECLKWTQGKDEQVEKEKYCKREACKCSNKSPEFPEELKELGDMMRKPSIEIMENRKAINRLIKIVEYLKARE